jgi:hypothetical protein
MKNRRLTKLRRLVRQLTALSKSDVRQISELRWKRSQNL